MQPLAHVGSYKGHRLIEKPSRPGTRSTVFRSGW